MEYSEELDIALSAVHRASRVTKNVMRGIDAFDKSDASPVTIADFAAQALMICAINSRFPDDCFIAEESADMLRKDSAALDRVWELVLSAGKFDADLPLPKTKEEVAKFIDLGSSPGGPRPGRIWILDPIDGTATFMKSQQYAVCLCLTVDGEQKVAVLGCPNLKADDGRVEEDITDKEGYGTVVYAVSGHGAFAHALLESGHGEERMVIRPGGRTDISQLIFTDSMKSSHADISTHNKIYRSLNVRNPAIDIWSMQMKYVALALGACDAMIRLPPSLTYRSCVWDHAGGQLIYQEAGGELTDIHGHNFEFGQTRKFRDNCGYVAADKEIHSYLLMAVQSMLEQRAA